MNKKIIIVLTALSVGVSIFLTNSLEVSAENHRDKKPKKTMITEGDPEEVGMNSEIIDEIDRIVNKHINAGVTPGAAVLVSKNGVIVKKEAYGYAKKYDMGNLLKDPIEMKEDTIFDLASVTKVMATTQGIMKLVNEKKINVSDKVSKYIPEFAKSGKENVTIEDLLTHTSGLTPWKPTFYHASNPHEVLEYISALPLEYPTGTKRVYSDFSYMTLGFVIEKVTGEKLDDYLENSIYKPLKMKDTMFTPSISLRDRIAATSWGNPYEYRMVADDNFGYVSEVNVEDFTGWRNYTLVGEVNDGNAFYANQGVAGHAGLFSTIEDLAILGQVMLNGGTYNNFKLYDDKVLNEFTKPQRFDQGYGFEINKNWYMGELKPKSTFGHTGFTGTQVIFDKENNLQIIILTNKQNNGVDANTKYASTGPLSREISDTVYRSMLPVIEVEGIKDGKTYAKPVKPEIEVDFPGDEENYSYEINMTLNGKVYIGETINSPGEYILNIRVKDINGNTIEKTLRFKLSNGVLNKGFNGL
ncbi:serine hydrolase [Clostridium polynesiense]|uniref:serine hydrolase n=1 Tax=Clostridium polynesiense TaxID=1325933 RepID=UPI000B1119CA|nr:serine hydrolase [Clostridium polynesiense]